MHDLSPRISRVTRYSIATSRRHKVPGPSVVVPSDKSDDRDAPAHEPKAQARDTTSSLACASGECRNSQTAPPPAICQLLRRSRLQRLSGGAGLPAAVATAGGPSPARAKRAQCRVPSGVGNLPAKRHVGWETSPLKKSPPRPRAGRGDGRGGPAGRCSDRSRGGVLLTRWQPRSD